MFRITVCLLGLMGEYMERFIQALISGLLMGGVYSTIAVGLSLAFGVMRVINWAHGELLMISMYLSFLIINATGWNPYLVIFIVGLIMFIFGYFFQGSVINRLLVREESREPISVLLFTAGLGMILSNFALIVFGANPIMVSTPYQGRTFMVGEVIVSVPRLISFAIAITATFLLYFFLQKTEAGRAIRATSQNRSIAQLMGINQKRIYALAFGIGIALVGISGGLLVPFFSIYPLVGLTFSNRSFIIVVLGGKGSVMGALVGGLIVGLIEQLAGQLLTDAYAQAIVFLLFVFVLLFRPSGLLGRESEGA